MKAAFVQPLHKALTQPACALLAATRPRRGSLSWSSPCRSEQPSSAAFCRVRACAEGHGSPPLPASARALGDPGPSTSSAGLPRSRGGKSLLAKSSLGSPCRSRGAGWGGAVSHPAAPQAVLVLLVEQQKARSQPEGGRRAEFEGEKPSHGYPLGGRGLGVSADPIACCRALQAQIDHGEPGVGTEAPGGRRAGVGQGIAVPKGSLCPGSSPCCHVPGVGSGRESCVPGG